MPNLADLPILPSLYNQQKSKTGVSVAPQKCPPKFFLKKLCNYRKTKLRLSLSLLAHLESAYSLIWGSNEI